MRQEVVLAMLAKEPSHGYELRARLREALGPLGEGMNAGQIYVTLTRLEKAGLLAVEVDDRPDGDPREQREDRPDGEVRERSDGAARERRGDRGDRKVYSLTADGQQRVAEWISEVSWPRPDLAEFHLKLVAAAAAGLADPLTVVDTQRRELLRRLRDVQKAVLAEPAGSRAALLLEGVVLRLQADLHWLEVCDRHWTHRRSGS
jgi:DNA-binding PadR family transcriptional regulator